MRRLGSDNVALSYKMDNAIIPILLIIKNKGLDMWYRNLLKVMQLARIDYEGNPRPSKMKCFLNNAFLMMF